MAAPIPLIPDTDILRAPAKEPLEDVKKELPEPEVQEEEKLTLSVAEPEAEASASPALCELATTDRLIITRRLRVKGVLYFRGKKNKFFVRTPDKNLVYTVEEENRWWVGYLCYGLRPLQLKITNCLGTEVIRIIRPYAFTTRILPCQLQRLQIYSPPTTKIGTVEQQWTAIKPLYLIRDKSGEPVFWIRGPKVTLSCFHDVQFQIVRPDGTPVGATCKRWEGVMHAMFLAAVTDRCGVAYEKNLSDEEKALLLSATLLLNYMYYDV